MHRARDACQDGSRDVEEVSHSFNAQIIRRHVPAASDSTSISFLELEHSVGYGRNEGVRYGLALTVEDNHIGNSLDLGELVYDGLDRGCICIQHQFHTRIGDALCNRDSLALILPSKVSVVVPG